MMKAFDERRKFVVAGVDKLSGVACVDPAGAFYVFPNISKLGLPAKQLELKLLDDMGIATIAAPASDPTARAICASPTQTASRTLGCHATLRRMAGPRNAA